MRYYSRLILVICLTLISLKLFAQENQHKRPKVGLVLSGGGAKGLAHIGVLKVLEEAGIRPDFIAGTSMGSIVGGLYAIGYSADDLDKISRETDWLDVIADRVSRRNLTIEEKEDADRFILNIPIKEKKLVIPSGVINGQSIQNLLNTLCAPVYGIRDFDEFQIPFLCVATDIESGKEVVFRHGYLPAALRASMSIPSIFNPIEINDILLVDGGVVNNFPVKLLKERGADIIIGVDVGFQYYKKEQLNSMLRIIEQSIFFYGEALNKENRQLVDILIEPDLQGYNASSFNSDVVIIAKGEEAARKEIARLTSLADSLRQLDPSFFPNQQLPQLDSMTIMEIRVRGLDNVSGELLNGKLQIEVFDKVTPKDIAKAINRLYSSLYFDRINYEIQALQVGVRLLIDVKESKSGQFRVGLHYDSDNKSSILLNATVRNLLINGSKFSLSTALGENPSFEGFFFKNNGWKPGYGFNFTVNQTRVYAYDNGRKISSFNFNESSTKFFTQSIVSNNYALGAGIEYEVSSLRPFVDPVLNIDTSGSFLNYYGFLNIDSYDNAFYPKKGFRLTTDFKLITNQPTDPTLFLVFRYKNAIPLTKRLTLLNQLYGGAVEGKSIPYQYYFYSGGIKEKAKYGILPFTGLEFMEKSSSNALILAADFQYQIFPNFYLILKGNIGNMKNSFTELFTINEILSGYGLTTGYDSWIGPIELSVSKSANRSGLIGFVNIGFWF